MSGSVLKELKIKNMYSVASPAGWILVQTVIERPAGDERELFKEISEEEGELLERVIVMDVDKF